MKKLISFSEANPADWFELADGRRIMLASLKQSLTYGGLLLGVPDERVNQSHIEYVLQKAAGTNSGVPAPHLIAPTVTEFKIPRQLRKLTRDGVGEAAGEVTETTVQRLPLVTCTARFRCPATIKAEADGFFAYSMATIVWFQDRFAMPIDPAVFTAIQALVWDAVAADVSD